MRTLITNINIVPDFVDANIEEEDEQSEVYPADEEPEHVDDIDL